MKNGDMPANVLVSSTGALWNLRDGHEDSQYLGQPGERFSIGMTKREMFAMAAMQGYCADGGLDYCYKTIAESAVGVADALLTELENKK